MLTGWTNLQHDHVFFSLIPVLQAASIIKNMSRAKDDKNKNPLFLYVAFAHTHTPLAYETAFENASSRPGNLKV